MFIRQCYRRRNGKRYAYWALVESYRTARGPRQRVVAWLGRMDESGRLGVEASAKGHSAGPRQRRLLGEEGPEPRWIEVDASAVRVENCRQFGGPWLALERIRRRKLDEFLQRVLPRGREAVPWWSSALILVIGRLCRPSSELYLAEQWYGRTALPELLGQNTQAARLFDVRVERTSDGRARLSWTRREEVRDWATLSAGCYLSRTNVRDWSDEELWKAYIQLPADRGRGGVSDREERAGFATDLASDRRPGVGSHSGVFRGVRSLEELGRVVSSGRAGR